MLRRVIMLAATVASLALPLGAKAATVKLALPVLSLESMPIFIAQEKGYLKKRGITLDVITSRGGGEAMKAYIAGEVQIVATGFPEVGLMRARGVDAQLYFAQMARVPFSLIARKDLNIKTVKDLKGKTIAVTSPGSLTANLARYFVMQAGLNPKTDVSLVSVGGGSSILGALKSKRADAAMLFEPFVTIAVTQGIATVVVDVAAKLDAFSSAPLSTSKAFLQKSPMEAKGIFDALAEALKFIHGNKADVLALAKKKFPNANPNVLEKALDHLYTVYSPNGKFPRAHVKRTEDICLSLNIMPKSYPYEQVVAPMARE